MSDNAIVAVIATVVTVVGAGGASYAAVRVALATLTAQHDALRGWLETVANGERKVDGQMQQQLATHETWLEDFGQRIHRIEVEHAARNHCFREED